MKNLLIIIAFVCSAVAGSAQQFVAGKVILNINAKDLRSIPLRIVLDRDDMGVNEYSVDTLKFDNTNTQFSYQTKEPMKYKLTLFWAGRATTSTAFWVSPGIYTLHVSENRQAEVIRSLPDQTLIKMVALDQKKVINYQTEVNTLSKLEYDHKSIQQAEAEVSALRDSLAKDLDENIYRKTMMENLDNPVGAYAFIRYAEHPGSNQRFKAQPYEMEKLMELLDTGIQNLPSLKIMAAKIARGKQMLSGKVMKDITLVNALDKPIKISDYKGKYLLVDFWASWCTPCRQEHPNMISMFKKYTASGFNILSVSRDVRSDKAAWLSAIDKDGTGIWAQVSDFNDLAKQTYDIRALPSNYLIDPAGKIIARDLRGEDLNLQLAKIFKK
ncbi:TlpA family protein disulfide reductase [Pedobacter duraquae]|uniref:Thiol-disulfide isomerase/thioredoxin n=1 Tax=Pedobacter duraquae TaxID=425511 RepID=A0A4R6IET4_9SPHI|nr:TlpA disulfide reductase family protein [Pedobacter duraquae]TDO20823.1 thiol-disulfide isomerase/thioredoxin [Pedobacter duraquae]